ncbi:hypothetical protein PC9H_010443 [Pleurotus ostreatus]|uniref:Uncharacterized protein n=1 Tax=Pleurotus ostreatus TaxID=5322 RepID=A0A8H6ZRM1_PLEOS|nr:uncharacterized protein PC9H_010443 [Pleurotus ostreatus]KAF7422287.1 hypothetical protein PC9H_010443 [Pleurotus ostreatus]
MSYTNEKPTKLSTHRAILRGPSHGLAVYAKPRNLVYEGKLIEVEYYPNLQYVAVSYAWDPSSEWVQWFGRKVTTQALHIVDHPSHEAAHLD